MIRRLGWLTALVISAAASAGAQGMPRRQAPAGPDWWVGVSYGLLQAGSVDDAGTNTRWTFGYTSQWAATLEKSLGSGTAVGVLASFATAPLQYAPSGSGAGAGGCSFGCDGHADVTQVLANLQFSGRGYFGTGFHGVSGFDAGVTQYGNFRDATGTKLPPASGAWDPTFGFRFGFGYYLSPWSDLYLAEQWATVLHKEASSTVQTFPPRVLTTRLGVRVGF